MSPNSMMDDMEHEGRSVAKERNRPRKRWPHLTRSTSERSRKILARDVFAIYRQLKKIEIEEFYSDVHIGNTNISITNFIYLFVNLIYGNLINIIDPNKFYMNIKPNFIENKLYIDFKIHVKPSIKNIIDILKAILIANKNSKKIKKEDKKYESNRINTKHHGNNA